MLSSAFQRHSGIATTSKTNEDVFPFSLTPIHPFINLWTAISPPLLFSISFVRKIKWGINANPITITCLCPLQSVWRILSCAPQSNIKTLTYYLYHRYMSVFWYLSYFFFLSYIRILIRSSMFRHFQVCQGSVLKCRDSWSNSSSISVYYIRKCIVYLWILVCFFFQSFCVWEIILSHYIGISIQEWPSSWFSDQNQSFT